MSALSESSSLLDRRVAWLLELLREELAPYPGRATVVARIVVSTVIVMVLVMTFQIPGAALAGYYAMILSRESPQATLAGAFELVLSFGAGVGYVLLSALFFFGSPVLHFLWVITSFFVIFFAIRVLRSYSAAAGFGFLIATCIPIWERTQSPELSVEATLWTAGSVALGAAVTVAVEYLYAPFKRSGIFEEGLLERWRVAANVLRTIALDQNLLTNQELAKDSEAARDASDLAQFASVGVSRLRRIMLRSGKDVEVIEQAGSLLSTTERLVDLVASLQHVGAGLPRSDDSRLLRAATRLEALEQRFENPEVNSEQVHEHMIGNAGPFAIPFLPEIERDISMLYEALEGRDDAAPSFYVAVPETKLSVFRPDTWTNQDHIRFALKGCLAASACYVFYSAIGWPGLNTSVATCIVTALSSIGSSRQKQILRITGALTGGLILGMGAQIVLLPNIDSIAGFTLLFAAVTAIAAWFSTASARLSYFGLQIALAFFLINLQEFAFQTSLTIARDRVFGILLGLIVMWLVFDLLGGERAADQMLLSIRQALLRLAELQELSLAPDAQAITRRVQAIREELIGFFGAVNTEADAILLETGRQREQHLVLREHVLALQPALRSLVLLQVTNLRYRRQRLLHELPETVATARRRFDDSMASFLRGLAASYPSAVQPVDATAYLALRQAIHQYYDRVAGGVLSVSARAVLSLSESMVDLADAIYASAPGWAGTSDPAKPGHGVVGPITAKAAAGRG